MKVDLTLLCRHAFLVTKKNQTEVCDHFALCCLQIRFIKNLDFAHCNSLKEKGILKSSFRDSTFQVLAGGNSCVLTSTSLKTRSLLLPGCGRVNELTHRFNKMCGRTACNLDPDDVAKCCRFRSSKNGKMQTPKWKNNSSGNYRPNCNVAPQAHTPVLISSKHLPKQLRNEQQPQEDEESERTLQAMRWGLIPSWYKGDPKAFNLSTNNARYDSLMDKASYKNPIIQGKRCVVLAEGFYEWKTSKDGKKQPYYIYFKKVDQKPEEKEEQSDCTNKRLLTMAGVFDCWKPVKGAGETADDGSIYSYSVITVNASSTFNWLHHRMPAILDGDEAVRMWLDYEHVPHHKALKLLKSVTDCLDWHPVTPRMNNSRYKDSDCTKPVDLTEKKPTKGGLMSWLIKSPKKENKQEESSKTDESPAKRQKIE